MSWRGLGAITLVLGGCAVDEADYPAAAAARSCQQWYKCDRGAFERSYATIDECTDDEGGVRAGVESALDLADLLGCSYDPALAAECLRDVRRSECSDFNVLEIIGCEAWVCG